ncbi:hypothetical protein A3F05_03780 [Candidatus Saccharibacteria bacterium RIFCSPHIGHO2_12_FULL_47_17]|nr:MAG: hypothetical protein A3F05_03780 [Candidatus Saccharibacteria bacterium RIFCSPHIGHO2_12_FULL_47_17]
MASKRQALGKGFDALIPKEIDDSILEENKHRVQKILITDIVPNPDQPRRSADEELTELVASVKHHGVLQPIIVIRHGGNYRIVAGERRWRAAKAAGHTNIPAIVRSLEELEQLEFSLIENIQRIDLSPLEQALAVSKLQQQFSLKLEEIAKKLGKAPSTLSNLTRLLELPQAAMAALREGKISEGHARAVLALKSIPTRQLELLYCILNNGWTVRQAEQFAVKAKRVKSGVQTASISASDQTIIAKLAKKLATGIRINRKVQGGQLVIQFKDDNELAKIIKKLGA